MLDQNVFRLLFATTHILWYPVGLWHCLLSKERNFDAFVLSSVYSICPLRCLHVVLCLFILHFVQCAFVSFCVPRVLGKCQFFTCCLLSFVLLFYAFLLFMALFFEMVFICVLWPFLICEIMFFFCFSCIFH